MMSQTALRDEAKMDCRVEPQGSVLDESDSKVQITDERAYRMPKTPPLEGKKIYARAWGDAYQVVVTVFEDSVVANLYTNEAIEQSVQGACPIPRDFFTINRLTGEVYASRGSSDVRSLQEWLRSLEQKDGANSN